TIVTVAPLCARKRACVMDVRLIGDLQSPDAKIRCAAAEAICRLGTGASEAAIALTRAVSDRDESVMQWATSALEGMGPPPKSAIPHLAGFLAGDNAASAYWAATLLGRLGISAAVAKPQLTVALQSP